MRILFSTLMAVSVLLASCSKSNDTSKTQTVFSFKANGQVYDWSGKSTTNYSQMIKNYYNDSTKHFVLLSTKGVNLDTANWPYLTIGVIAPTLEVKTYIGLKDMLCTIGLPNGATNYTEFPPDSVKLTITSIHDGMADGTFSARMTYDAPSIIVTDGVFRNIPFFPPQ